MNLCHILPKFLTFDVIFVTSYYDVITCKWLLVCFVIKFRLCLVSINNICYHSVLALLFLQSPKVVVIPPPIDAYPSVKSWMHPPLNADIRHNCEDFENLISYLNKSRNVLSDWYGPLFLDLHSFTPKIGCEVGQYYINRWIFQITKS